MNYYNCVALQIPSETWSDNQQASNQTNLSIDNFTFLIEETTVPIPKYQFKLIYNNYIK